MSCCRRSLSAALVLAFAGLSGLPLHDLSNDLAHAQTRSYPFFIGPKLITSMVSLLHHHPALPLLAALLSTLFVPITSSHLISYPNARNTFPYMMSVSLRAYCTTIPACIAAIIMNVHGDVSHTSHCSHFPLHPPHRMTNPCSLLPSCPCSRCIAKLTTER
jgi:hypothetical protein